MANFKHMGTILSPRFIHEKLRENLAVIFMGVKLGISLRGKTEIVGV
jgi:hypothetical protein